ncbi:MAG: transglutaminase protein [Paenibacillus sp.]|jgi:transglutaminase-like putative cysteine protease|nr:transglutaminase protein [Paenibacillus sp.]
MPQMPIVPPPSYKAALQPHPAPGMPDAPPQPWTARLVSALLLFWLLREWIVPLGRLSDITELYRITPFLIAFGLFLALDVLRVPGEAGWPLKAAVIFGTAAVLHSGQWIPDGSWWTGWLRDLSGDALDMAHARFAELEPVNRTILFLAGWSFFIGVVQSFAAERQQIGWFVMMTLCYLVILQLIFDMDMSYGLLSASAAGLLLQGSLQAERWLRWKREPSDEADVSAAGRWVIFNPSSSANQDVNSTRLPRTGKEKIRSGRPYMSPVEQLGNLPTIGNAAPFAASLAVAGLCLFGAWMGAGLHPQQGKPVDWSGYIQNWERVFPFSAWNASSAAGEGRFASSKAKTGYSGDDSKLGYPLEPDDQVAFTARTTQLTYWRGEAKNVYTGHGWSQTYSQSVQNVAGAALAADDDSGSAKSLVYQELTLRQQGLDGQLFLGGDLVKVDSLVSTEGKPVSPEWIWKNKLTDRVLLPALADPLASYKVQVLAWSRTPQLPDRPETYVFSHEIEDTYLQLPDKLPSRVAELAESVTKGMDSPYEKVKAIEQFLQQSYAYSMEQSRPPSAGQDLVDQFLFELKAGYCDHFSSAMVVMLRSVGIPSRWVKGFAPGEVIAVETVTPGTEAAASLITPAVLTEGTEPQQAPVESSDPNSVYAADSANGTSVYTVEVRNKDAHSWVEVYFPSAGWVLFDPTPGFNRDNPSSSGTSANVPSAADGTPAEAAAGLQAASGIPALLHFVPSMEQVIPMLRTLKAALTTYAAGLLPIVHSSVLWMKPWLPLFLLITTGVILLFTYMWIRNRYRLDVPRPSPHIPGEREQDSLTGSMRNWLTVRLSDRIWSKLQRRLGTANPAQTMREYLLTRSNTSGEQRSSLLRLVQLLESVRYCNANGRVTNRQLHAAWREFRKASNGTP